MNNSTRPPAWRTNRSVEATQEGNPVSLDQPKPNRTQTNNNTSSHQSLTTSHSLLANTKMNYIKTNNKWARQRGTTLIELSVVIAVILLLVGVLFIGVTAWRNGANKAACMVQLSSIQKAARGWENTNPDGLAAIVEGTTVLTPTTPSLVGPTGFFAVWPTDPYDGLAFGDVGHVPKMGEVFATSATLTAAKLAGQTANW
jgi:type II secretory pathway pseudopilin PulG